ncbi:MAG TPA: glycine cleavage system protein H [Bacillota bacterium]|nr:glycine cleavage system protein H [Bacillota bacterium]
MDEKLYEIRYSREHIWVQRLESTVLIGFAEFALEALGEIVALELPRTGDQVKEGQSIGVIESAKTVSDLYSPIDGEILRINDRLANTLDQRALRDKEWLIEIRMQQPKQWETLLTAEQYLEWLKGES